jgi:hypothetical protein
VLITLANRLPSKFPSLACQSFVAILLIGVGLLPANGAGIRIVQSIHAPSIIAGLCATHGQRSGPNYSHYYGGLWRGCVSSGSAPDAAASQHARMRPSVLRASGRLPPGSILPPAPQRARRATDIGSTVRMFDICAQSRIVPEKQGLSSTGTR